MKVKGYARFLRRYRRELWKKQRKIVRELEAVDRELARLREADSPSSQRVDESSRRVDEGLSAIGAAYQSRAAEFVAGRVFPNHLAPPASQPKVAPFSLRGDLIRLDELATELGYDESEPVTERSNGDNDEVVGE